MSIKHLIFDFDGTLVQSRDLAVDLFNTFSKKYGYTKMKKEEVEYFSTLSILDRIKVLGVPMHRLPQLLNDVKRKYKDDIINLEPVVDIKAVLELLTQNNIELGIISSNTHGNIIKFLNKNNFPRIEKVYCGSNIFGKHRIIKKYLKTHRIDIREAIYIGDELRDVLSCKKIGIKMAAVDWGYDSLELMKQYSPDFLFYKPFEITELI